MKKNSIILLCFLILTLFFAYLAVNRAQKEKQSNSDNQPLAAEDKSSDVIQKKNNPANQNVTDKDEFVSPLDNPTGRVTKKYFATFVTPKSSPVSPERFYGYHVGIDLETFTEEANIDVIVRSACEGKLLLKKNASGYGGVAVQSCVYRGQDITVIYGHLKLSSVSFLIGQNISAGEKLGILGEGYSNETDGERKHLHLGFHKGKEVNILGYVQDKTQLENWIDPCGYLCK